MTTMTKEYFVGQLLCKANEMEMKEVADVLKEYKVSQDRKTNSDKVGKKSKPDLIETLLFLHGTTAEDSPVMKEELSKKLKNILVTKVVNRIVSIQPDACKACRKSYYFDITERPSLRCLTCDRGACQECYTKDEEALRQVVMKNAGIYFICNPINTDVREDAMHKGRKTKTTPASGLEAETTPAKGMEAEVTPAEGMDSHVIDVDQISTTEDVEELGSDNEDYVIPKEQMKKKEKLEKKKKKEEEAKKEEGDKTKDKCKLYMKNRCTHGVAGEKCPFFHPKRCPKWMKAGKDGCKKCNLFHPAICYGSLNEKRCDKSSCTFIHLPGTVTTPKSIEGGEGTKSFPKDGMPNKNKLDCIICPKVFNSEKQLTHHVNTIHSHKCAVCKKEFSHIEDRASHKRLYHMMIDAVKTVSICPRTGRSSQDLLVTKPQELGQKELMKTVTTMMKEMIKEIQQQMMNLFSQMMQQQQQQTPVLPMGWRMPGQH